MINKKFKWLLCYPLLHYTAKYKNSVKVVAYIVY